MAPVGLSDAAGTTGRPQTTAGNGRNGTGGLSSLAAGTGLLHPTGTGTTLPPPTGVYKCLLCHAISFSSLLIGARESLCLAFWREEPILR